MRISINQTPGTKHDFGFTIKWDVSGISVASVEKGNYDPNSGPNYTVLSFFSSVSVGNEKQLDLEYSGYVWERCISVEAKDEVSSLRQIVGITKYIFPPS